MSDNIKMSDSVIVKMSDSLVETPDKFFPIMKLPYELRQKIWTFVVVKPDGYIGQANSDGVDCPLGAALRGHSSFLSTTPDYRFHFPTGCRNPIHEEQQIFQDFVQYRSLDLALSCKEIYEEVTEVFFKENGFELRDAHDTMCFLFLIGPYCINLLRNLRVFHNLNLKPEDHEYVFSEHGGSCKSLCLLFEQEYLEDDQPSTDLVWVLHYLKFCNKLQNFDLTYRLNVPGAYFTVSKVAEIGFNFQTRRPWFGESLQMELHTKNVLEKLRQDNGMRTDEIINVEEDFFAFNSFTEQISLTCHNGKEFLAFFRRALGRACIAHAENCIEYSAFGQHRIMGTWSATE